MICWCGCPLHMVILQRCIEWRSETTTVSNGMFRNAIWHYKTILQHRMARKLRQIMTSSAPSVPWRHPTISAHIHVHKNIHRNLNYVDTTDMLRCIISESTQQKVMGLLYMTASGSLFNMFVLLKRGKALSFFWIISNLMTWDTKNARTKSLRFIVLSFALYGDTGWTRYHIKVPHEVNSEADCTSDDHRVTYLPCRKKKEMTLTAYCRGIWLTHWGLWGC